MVFVFGANELGRHGAGAARWAVKCCGAVYGKGYGRQGNSFAIPTKDKNMRTRDLIWIKSDVNLFIAYAIAHGEEEFKVTRIGCGLAGCEDGDIAPMFKDAPDNCLFDRAWEPWLPGKRFWGAF